MRLIVALLTPLFFAMVAARYAFLEFSRNDIIPPDLWIGTFLVAFFTFTIVYFISFAIYLWRYC